MKFEILLKNIQTQTVRSIVDTFDTVTDAYFFAQHSRRPHEMTLSVKYVR